MSAEKLHHTTLKVFAPRDPQESHRAATPLELLFDLVFVVAIATASRYGRRSFVACFTDLLYGVFLHFGGHG